MIKLNKVVLINWMYFQKATLNINGNTALVGINGTGKSTLIDAIQMLLLGQQQAKFNESLKKYVPSDDRNLIYGRYFVVRFIFNNIDNIPFRFENLSINYNVY